MKKIKKIIKEHLLNITMTYPHSGQSIKSTTSPE